MAKVVNINYHSYDQYIGRGTEFGNPYPITMNESRTVVIKKYEQYMRNKIVADPSFANRLLELDGKVLGCHCKPKACHGDVLVKLIEEIKRPQLDIGDI